MISPWVGPLGVVLAGAFSAGAAPVLVVVLPGASLSPHEVPYTGSSRGQLATMETDGYVSACPGYLT